jgi:LPXTG-site transpeptidase (sortase) family protein
MAAAPLPLIHRALAAAIAVVLASGLGAAAGDVAHDEVSVAAADPVAAPAAPDLAGLAHSAAALVRGLEAPLPIPQPVPDDPRAPTPVVRHGMLEIPAIGLRQPFFEGVTLTAIDNGPSHWPGTAMPGQLGNVVVAGHRVTKTRPFYDLDLVQPGDELIFTMDDGTRHVYVLDRIEIVAPDAVEIVSQSYGYRATLFGCHPKGTKQQRIVGHFTLRQQ